MKKDILKILMGALLIAIIVLVGGRQYLSMKKKEYRQQLENTLNNKYLEGEDAIGAFYYHRIDKDSTEVKKVSLILHDGFSQPLWDYPGICTVIFFGGHSFYYSPTIIDVLKSGDYEWYDFDKCATTYRPFMIIVKKTNRGYDIIGEYILGIALTYSYPDCLIRETSYTFDWGKLWGNYDFGERICYNYHIKTDMIDSYIKNLFENKYNGITIRNEVTRGNERNIKFDMLDGLVMKGACPIDSSMYFNVSSI